MGTILELKNIKKYFPIPVGGFPIRKYKQCKAVDDISFSVNEGACFGIAGESGSGKSTVSKLILNIETLNGGNIVYKSRDLSNLTQHDRTWYQSQVQTIFQDAASSLNPRMCIRKIVSEPLEVQKHNRLSKKEIEEKTEAILYQVGLGSANLKKYPHELSGGQKQRVAIARAIIMEPSLVILDEPVSALDVSIRAQILNLLVDIQKRKGIAYIIIAHDLGMLQNVTTQIAVMYLGKIVEIGETEKVFTNPMHPYTKALFAAVPKPDPHISRQSPALLGEIGSPIDPLPGCLFNPRCGYAITDCKQIVPPLKEVCPGHKVACHLIR
jgi:oligopeptide/dipeptide ABC transporter ATP-binding protein